MIADSNGQFAPVRGLEFVPYQSDAFVTFRDGDYITNWQPCTTVATGAYVQTDYDFEKPSADLATKADNPLGHPQDDDERYHYPGKYTEMGPGDGLTQIRLQEVQAPSRRAEGLTTAPAFWSGTRLELTGFPREAENETYIVLRAAYRAWNDQYRSGAREERPPEAYEATSDACPDVAPLPPGTPDALAGHERAPDGDCGRTRGSGDLH